MDVAVNIGATGLKKYAKGDTIEARFKALCSREAQSAGNWMSTNEDVCFRATIGALLLSYPEGLCPANPQFQAFIGQSGDLLVSVVTHD